MIFYLRWGERLLAWMRAVRRRVVIVGDVAPAALVALLLLGVLDETTSLRDSLREMAEMTAIGQGVALYWRRSHPRLVMAAAVAGGLIFHVAAPQGLFPYAGLVALWSLATVGPSRVSVVGLGALLAVTALNLGRRLWSCVRADRGGGGLDDKRGDSGSRRGLGAGVPAGPRPSAGESGAGSSRRHRSQCVGDGGAGRGGGRRVRAASGPGPRGHSLDRGHRSGGVGGVAPDTSRTRLPRRQGTFLSRSDRREDLVEPVRALGLEEAAA
jgi:hypothetical protein